MSRKKTVPDNDLIALIDNFYYHVCDGDGTKLKLPAIAQFIAKSGYPDYQVTTLRRNTIARDHIKTLKKNSSGEKISFLIVYNALNPNEFLKAHPSRASLVAALSERDAYYRKVAENAIEFHEQFKDVYDQCEDLKSKLFQATENEKQLRSENDLLKQKLKDSNQMCKYYKDTIAQYVLPEVAKVILQEERIIGATDTDISEKAVSQNMFTASSNILQFPSFDCIGSDPTEPEADVNAIDESESDVIKGMLDPFM